MAQTITLIGVLNYTLKKIESFVKEVPFRPGSCFLFEANKYSYHGTQFDNGINGYRFMLGAEYVDK